MLIVVVFVQFVLFIVLFFFGLYFASMLISDFFGVPFVPSRNQNFQEALDKLVFNKKDVFYDLGSGDGRLVFYAAKNFGIKAVGVELNPLLITFCRIKKKISGNKKVAFLRQNVLKTNLSSARVIYMFLFPELVKKLSSKIKKECLPGTVIVSHGFEAKELRQYQQQFLKDKPFSTYFYRL